MRPKNKTSRDADRRHHEQLDRTAKVPLFLEKSRTPKVKGVAVTALEAEEMAISQELPTVLEME